MPKVVKISCENKRSDRFSLKWVQDRLNKWRKASIVLEATARREFGCIRGYIVTFEHQMTTSERENLLKMSGKIKI